MRDSRRGFTILEAAVAVAIIGVTAVGVLTAFGAEARGAARTRDALVASTLARARLARLEATDAGELASLPDSVARGQFAPPLDDFRWIASSVTVDGEQDLYDLRVVIAWSDGRSELRTRRFRPVPLIVGR